jgi:hypothetical protein
MVNKDVVDMLYVIYSIYSIYSDRIVLHKHRRGGSKGPIRLRHIQGRGGTHNNIGFPLNFLNIGRFA